MRPLVLGMKMSCVFFVNRVKPGEQLHVADVPARDEARHSDAGRAPGRRDLPPSLQELPPKPSAQWIQAPLLDMRRQGVGKALWRLQVPSIFLFKCLVRTMV